MGNTIPDSGIDYSNLKLQIVNILLILYRQPSLSHFPYTVENGYYLLLGLHFMKTRLMSGVPMHRSLIRQSVFAILFPIILAATVSGMSRKPADLPYAPGEVLVKFHDHVESEKAAEIVREEGGKVQRILGPTGVYLVTLPEGADVMEAVERFLQRPEVSYAEPNYRARRLEEK